MIHSIFPLRVLFSAFVLVLVGCAEASSNDSASLSPTSEPALEVQESTTSFSTMSVATGHMAFTTQPAGAGLYTGFAQQPVVTLYDASGAVSASPVNIQLKIASGPSGAILSGLNVNQQASVGVTKFSDLSLNVPGTYVLTATAAGYGSVNSAPFVVQNHLGTAYYVSPTGNDSNTGKSPTAAWKTVGKVNAMTFQAGDVLLFEGGKTFTGCLTIGPKIHSTATQPFTIGSYGGGGKFQLNANCTKQESTYSVLHNTAAVHIGAITGFVLQDCILRGNEAALAAKSPQPSPPIYGAAYGVLFDNGGWASGLTTASVTIQRCDIGGFYTPATTDFGGGIFFNSNGPTHQISILNSSLHGLNGVQSVEDNGIGVNGNAVKSRLSDVVVQGNHVYNIGGRPHAPGGTVGSGLMLGGSRVLIQNNVAHDTGANTATCGGPSNIWAVSADHVTIQYNEVYRSGPKDPTIASGGPNAGGCDWDGFDLDIGVTNSVVQYNYSHNNWGAGFLAYISGTWGPNTYRYNISIGDGKKGFGSLTIANWSNTPGTIYAYNNFFDSVPTNGYPFLSGGKAVTGYVANNLFRGGVSGTNSLFANTNGSSPVGLKLTHNAYWSMLAAPTASFFNWGGAYHGMAAWQTATGQDPAAKSYSAPANPSAVIPPATITCSVASVVGARNGSALVSCLGNAYQLGSASTMIGAGLDLRKAPYSLNIGVRDFFGNALGIVMSGSHFDIGVD